MARSLLTMTAVNLLLFSDVIAKLQNLERVVWIGVHVDMLEYMKMSEVPILILMNNLIGSVQDPVEGFRQAHIPDISQLSRVLGPATLPGESATGPVRPLPLLIN